MQNNASQHICVWWEELKYVVGGSKVNWNMLQGQVENVLVAPPPYFLMG